VGRLAQTDHARSGADRGDVRPRHCAAVGPVLALDRGRCAWLRLAGKSHPIHDTDDIERNIVEFTREPNGGLLLPTDSFTIVHQELIVALTARYRLPTIAGSSDYASKGGLMSYAIDYPQQFRQAAIYADRILKGTKPGDLPIQLPTKFNLVINLKTARALGVDVPTSLLMNADEVIE
jgi:putative ABC transport system substrate-binding protein